MKKIKTFFKIITILVITGIMIHILSNQNYKTKTKYGDVFYLQKGDSGSIGCLEHNFCLSVKYIGSKNDIKHICDTKYFRCYKLENPYVNIYICGLKPDGDYFWIGLDEEAPPFFKEKYSEDFKKVFLADKYIMEVTLNYMDNVYHKEMQEIAKKLTSGDYEGLEQYGLTQEMINDKDSLGEKIRIMEDYLNNVPRTELNK